MLKYLVKRLFYAILTIVGVVTVVFFLQRLTGDPTSVLLPPEMATEEEIQCLRSQLGLDQNIFVQYKNFIVNLFQLDMGYSYRQGTAALPLVLERLPASFRLAVLAMLVATVLGVASGVVAAVKRNTFVDKTVMAIALIGQAMPVYWIGILMIIIFSVKLNILPSMTDGLWQSMIMPVCTLGGYTAARIARVTRSSMLEVLQMDFVRTAKGKGLRKKKVVMKHAFRNALIPIVTVIGMEFGALIGGSVITETVFAWPGVGRLMVEAILGRDYPVVQAVVFVICAIFVFVNLGVDLIYGYLDPRIKVGK